MKRIISLHLNLENERERAAAEKIDNLTKHKPRGAIKDLLVSLILQESHRENTRKEEVLAATKNPKPRRTGILGLGD